MRGELQFNLQKFNVPLYAFQEAIFKYVLLN